MKIQSLLIAVCIIFSISLIGIASEDTHYPLEVVDGEGTTVIIEQQPQKIMSVMPSNTEILFAIGAGDFVVGGTIHDKYPEEAKSIEKVGGYASLDIEKIIDLDPDLVVAGDGNSEEDINMLRHDLGMDVIVLIPQNVEEIIKNIKLLGQITNNTENALTVTSKMEQHIENITKVSETIPEEVRPRVLYVVWDDPLYVAGNNTFPDDLIEIAGGKNIMKTDGWIEADLEDVLDRDPEIIICSSMGIDDQSVSDELAEKLRNNELLAYTSAVQNNRIYPISDPNIIEIPGPRIVQGLEEFHSMLGPVAEEKMQENNVPKDNETQKDSPGFGPLLACIALIGTYMRQNRIRK